VADTGRKERTIDSKRSAIPAVKGKKMGVLKYVPVRELHSISSRIWIVIWNCFFYVRTCLGVNFCWKLCDYFAHTNVVNIFLIWPFLLYKKWDFCSCCRRMFLLFRSLYCGYFLWITRTFLTTLLLIWNEKPPLSEIVLQFFQTFPLQRFGFYLVSEYMLQ
jgi:hypothetical protein